MRRSVRSLFLAALILGIGAAVAPAVALAAPPANDNFADAVVVGALPYTSPGVNLDEATIEAGEPEPSCYNTIRHTAWYSFTPAESGTVTVRTDYGIDSLAAFTGTGLTGLTELDCGSYYDRVTLSVEAGTTYHFQLGNFYQRYNSVRLSVVVTPDPVPDFYWYPGEPSRFDEVNFLTSVDEPGGEPITEYSWDLGDGTTSTEQYATHHYGVDGDYPVTLTVRTEDGRTGSVTRTVSVRTHDVAVVEFTVPQAGRAGQTKPISARVRNVGYLDVVEVRLEVSRPGDFEYVGALRLTVPVRPNRSTEFLFSYTFTDLDALIGKVNFRVTASVVGAHDALPGDNVAISPQVRVRPPGTASAW